MIDGTAIATAKTNALASGRNDCRGLVGSENRARLGARFVGSAVEGLDTILLTLIDVARARTTEDADLLNMMTSEDGNGVANVRSAYLAEESELKLENRMKLLAAANHCERLIWLFGSLGRSYMKLKTA